MVHKLWRLLRRRIMCHPQDITCKIVRKWDANVDNSDESKDDSSSETDGSTDNGATPMELEVGDSAGGYVCPQRRAYSRYLAFRQDYMFSVRRVSLAAEQVSCATTFQMVSFSGSSGPLKKKGRRAARVKKDMACQLIYTTEVSPRGCLGPEQQIPKALRLLSMSPLSGEWLRDLVLQCSHLREALSLNKRSVDTYRIAKPYSSSSIHGGRKEEEDDDE
ncbi:hypothetical protein LguiB_020756 [Lonicera macranthoides]